MGFRGLFSSEGFIGLAIAIGLTLGPPAAAAYRWLVGLLGAAGVTVPDWLTFQAVATIVVLFLVGRAFYVEETRVTVTEGWLRAKLVEYGFNEGDALAHAKEGVHYLGDHRMWDQRRVEKMLTSSYVRSTLERFYGEILDRKPDPEGVCQWGAMLYNAPRLERKRMEDHVRERIEKRKLEGWA